MVLAHARALLTGTRPGTTNYLDTGLRDTEAVLTGAAALLDFRQPIAVLLIGVLQLIPDRDQPHAIVARLMEAAPSGSWLAVFHPASDILPDKIGEAARRVNVRSGNTVTLRSRSKSSSSSVDSSCWIRAWCRSTGGGPAQSLPTLATRWPDTPASPESPDRGSRERGRTGCSSAAAPAAMAGGQGGRCAAGG